MQRIAVQSIGWYGVVTILLGYALVNFSWIDIHSYAYQLLNLTGAVALVIETGIKRDRQPMMLNIIWAIIAATAIINLAWF